LGRLASNLIYATVPLTKNSLIKNIQSKNIGKKNSIYLEIEIQANKRF